MKEHKRRVLPPKIGRYSAIAVWDGPQSLNAVMRLKGKGKLEVVQPKDADGNPIDGSPCDCLRIENPERVSVAHPGDLVVTDWYGYFDVVHGLEWAAAHGHFASYEGDADV